MTYGDIDNVKIDVGLLRHIIARQGTDILLESIAEHTLQAAKNFSLSQSEVQWLVDANVDVYRKLVADRT